VRIVSLLPSATESLFALGLGDALVAVTHECDFPPDARRLPVVTRSTLPLADSSSGDIEALVSAAALEQAALYEVDFARIRELEPDLVVGQDVCDVCAVPMGRLGDRLEGIPVLLQHPHSLEDVLDDIAELGRVAGADPEPLLTGLRARVDAVAGHASAAPRIRTVFLEWLDPPNPAGHWTPDLLRLAGLEDPLARPGRPSVARTWEDVRAARPELLVMAPCGFEEPRARAEAELVRELVESVEAGRVAVLDGSAYFNRPGPRLGDSLELLWEVREGRAGAWA
jgi:iron complex transport system substrate-binding protein